MASPQPFPSIMVLLLAMTITASLILTTAVAYFLYCFWKTHFRGSRTSPFDGLPRLQRFSFKELKTATGNFDAANSIGKGGSGCVYRGVLKNGKLVAVKVLDPVYFQCEYEFQNEVRILGGLKPSPFVIRLLGFCVEEEKRLLVFDYMPNRSLQESLVLESDDGLILSWRMRFSIIRDVVKALGFLHRECNPPVVHGDVKPSNVLLDSEFRARISDFGLSRLKLDSTESSVDLNGTMSQVVKKLDFGSCGDLKGKEVSVSAAENCGFGNKSMAFDADLGSTEHSRDLNPSSDNVGEDWWWKQDGSGELCSNEYVMGWIRSQVYPSGTPDSDVEKGVNVMTENPTQEPPENTPQVKKHRKMVEWWKEEQLNDTIKKAKNKLRSYRITIPLFGFRKCFTINRVQASEKDDEENNLEFSFRRGCNCREEEIEKPSPSRSGEMFSRELSSTTSVRGTFCYVAPEYGEDNSNCLMEKGDIYSLGVLILVTMSGRRPLHMLSSSPMKFEKANLISWSRSLARSGNILELVDKRLKDEYNKEEASLCIKLALSCLQKMPDLRPDIGNVLRILDGETELLPPPCHSTPSPQSGFSQKSRKKLRKCASEPELDRNDKA